MRKPNSLPSLPSPKPAARPLSSVVFALLVIPFFAFPVSAQAAPEVASEIAANPPLVVEDHERLITILGTNDIHGGVEPGKTREGDPIGGMAQLSGVVSSIRKGIASRFGSDRAGVLLVDAGDQFQGTLVSNFNEGQLVFAAMNLVGGEGYAAAVPGNHDYDFGPIGWLEDQVTPGSGDQDPRGALLRLVKGAKFPLVSANTFLKGTSRHPDFLLPFAIREVAGGVRVALIGLDHPGTPSITTAANVSDLRFEAILPAYRRVRAELEGKADIFVAIIHEGNTEASFPVSAFVQALPEGAVDAVVAGHTHFMNNARVRGAPIIQSNANGLKFGRIDLVWDARAKRVVPGKTRAFAGVELAFDRCSAFARSFCEELPGGKGVAYEGVPVVADARIEALVARARAEVAPIASKRLGVAEGLVRVDRTRESPLANALTDGVRALAGTDVAFLNTGGIRAPLEAGEVTYEALYRVLPFGNRGLVIGPMAAEKVLSLLARSVQTCGAFGALMQSGLKVAYERDCRRSGTAQVDAQARLLRVETLDGEVVLDVAKGIVAPAGRAFSVATLDFLAAGGAGYEGFAGTPVVRDLGIVRESLVDHYVARPASFGVEVDGRWEERLPGETATAVAN